MNRFQLHIGMIPQGTQSESAQFDFDLEAYLNLATTWDKTSFSLEGIVGVAGPELAIFGIESPIGLLTVRDQFVLAAPFIECGLGIACHPIGGPLFVKKRAAAEITLSGLTFTNLILLEDVNFPELTATPAPYVYTYAAAGTYTASWYAHRDFMPIDPATGAPCALTVAYTGDCTGPASPTEVEGSCGRVEATVTCTGAGTVTLSDPATCFYDDSYQATDQAFRFGDILTLKGTTIGRVRITSILGLAADPQCTNLLKKKGFPGEACTDGFGFTVEKLFIENLTIGSLRLDSETEFRLEEPVEETWKLFYPLAGIGDLTALLVMEDILAFELERAILKLRSGAFTLTTVFDSTLSITSHNLIAYLRLFEGRTTLFTATTLVPGSGLSSLSLYALIQVNEATGFRMLTLFSGGGWSLLSLTLSTTLGGLEFDTQARFLPTGLDQASFDLMVSF